VRNGRIGVLKRVVTFVGYHNKTGPGPGWQPAPVPEGFDYETWLGPAPRAPYHPDRCLYRFRFIYDVDICRREEIARHWAERFPSADALRDQDAVQATSVA